LQRFTRKRSELTDFCHKIEACVHGAFSIILVTLGISKRSKNFITHRIDNGSPPARDDFGANVLETSDSPTKVLRIRVVCERCQANEPAREHGDLPRFRLGMSRGNALTGCTCGCESGPVEQRLAILGTLRLYSEFVPDAWHGKDKCWRLRVRLDLAP